MNVSVHCRCCIILTMFAISKSPCLRQSHEVTRVVCVCVARLRPGELVSGSQRACHEHGRVPARERSMVHVLCGPASTIVCQPSLPLLVSAAPHCLVPAPRVCSALSSTRHQCDNDLELDVPTLNNHAHAQYCQLGPFSSFLVVLSSTDCNI